MLFKLLFLNFLLIVNTYANSNTILSNHQKNILNFSSEKAIKDSDKLKIDWINPITYTYTYQDDDKNGISKNSILSISQPIFRSGGIYSAIKYANNIEASSKISIEIQKKELVKNALNIVFNIKKLNIQIKQQKLQIQNAIIDVKNKKESVFNGLLDISFLNNAIINLNSKKSQLLDLQYNKKSLINSLSNLSDLKYQDIKLPTFTKLKKEDFTKQNIYIQKDSSDIKSTKNMRWITAAKYLPTVNLTYNYTRNHTLDTTDKNYGFNIIVPLDFKAFDDSGSSKIAYLKAKENLNIKKLQEKNIFKTSNLKIDMLNAKLKLTKENIIAYNDLVAQTTELKDAGIKTQDDLTILENSTTIEKLNLKIYNIDKQIEFLEVYARIYNDKI